MSTVDLTVTRKCVGTFNEHVDYTMDKEAWLKALDACGHDRVAAFALMVEEQKAHQTYVEYGAVEVIMFDGVEVGHDINL